jgi:hypothetical protein
MLTLNVPKEIKLIIYAQANIVKKQQLLAVKKHVHALKIIQIANFRFINHQLNIFKEKYIVFNHFKN